MRRQLVSVPELSSRHELGPQYSIEEGMTGLGVARH